MSVRKTHSYNDKCLPNVVSYHYLNIFRVNLLLMWSPPFIIDRVKHSEKGKCMWSVANNREFALFVAVAGYHGPSISMILCYIKVFTVMKKSKALKTT